jgi:hypothetical protein
MGGGAAAAEEETHGRSARGQNKRTAESREPSADSPQYAHAPPRAPCTTLSLTNEQQRAESPPPTAPSTHGQLSAAQGRSGSWTTVSRSDNIRLTFWLLCSRFGPEMTLLTGAVPLSTITTQPLPRRPSFVVVYRTDGCLRPFASCACEPESCVRERRTQRVGGPRHGGASQEAAGAVATRRLAGVLPAHAHAEPGAGRRRRRLHWQVAMGHPHVLSRAPHREREWTWGGSPKEMETPLPSSATGDVLDSAVAGCVDAPAYSGVGSEIL